MIEFFSPEHNPVANKKFVVQWVIKLGHHVPEFDSGEIFGFPTFC